jgi:hypothetical protein
MEEITQDTATLALIMEREVDKRVMVALSRALNPTDPRQVHEIERAYAGMNPGQIQNVVASMLINAVLADGSLMHNIRSKLAEQLNRHY